MRIFHLSDLHIGLKLINRDLREDQEYILDQIIQKAAEKVPDAIVIAGDIYDKAVPSAEAVEVFDHFYRKAAKCSSGFCNYDDQWKSRQCTSCELFSERA